MSVTIAEVARLAGVSTATVSRVLNGKVAVDAGTRARVEAAVQELNYTPSHAARSLGSGQSFMLGLILPDIANPFFPMLARGAGDAARAAGYNLVLVNSDSDSATEAEAVRALRARQVDGLIVAPAGPRADWLPELLQASLPVVLIDRPVAGPPVDVVTADNRAGGALVARHLVEAGHSKLGFIAGPAGLASADERYQGFAEAAHALGAELRSDWVARGDFQLLSGFRAMQQLLDLDERPTAVACGNDLMALGALRAARLAELSVPGEVTVTGYDDIPMAAMADPALTTVAQPVYRMGVAAVDRLLARRQSPEAPPVRIQLGVRLVVRESSDSGKRGQPAWL